PADDAEDGATTCTTCARSTGFRTGPLPATTAGGRGARRSASLPPRRGARRVGAAARRRPRGPAPRPASRPAPRAWRRSWRRDLRAGEDRFHVAQVVREFEALRQRRGRQHARDAGIGRERVAEARAAVEGGER